MMTWKIGPDDIILKSAAFQNLLRTPPRRFAALSRTLFQAFWNFVWNWIGHIEHYNHPVLRDLPGISL